MEIDHDNPSAMMHMLGEMKGLLTALLNRIDAIEKRSERDLAGISKRIEVLDSRVTALEKDENKKQGMAIAARLIIPSVWAMIITLVGGVAWLVSSVIGGLIHKGQ